MTLQDQIAQMRREIDQWQKDPAGSAAMKRQLQALQTELDSLAQRAQRDRPKHRPRPLIAVVKPVRPPQPFLSRGERAVWGSFFRYHRALLQYTGWVNRTEWLQMADVAADMTGADMSQAAEFPDFPSGWGVWAWDAKKQLWTLFPTSKGVYGWDGGEQKWVLIDEGGGIIDMEDAPSTGLAYGRRNGLWVPVQASTGVTDGSSAAPGQVGELIAASHPGGTNPSVPITVGTYVSITSISLSAGDWDLAGSAQMSLDSILVGTGVVGLVSFSLTVGPAGNLPGSGIVDNWGWYAELHNGAGYAEGPLPTQRIVLTSPATVYLVGSVNPTAADPSPVLGAAGYIRARRMR